MPNAESQKTDLTTDLWLLTSDFYPLAAVPHGSHRQEAHAPRQLASLGKGLFERCVFLDDEMLGSLAKGKLESQVLKKFR